jgi:cobalamin biosynthesis protein CobT
VVAGPPRAAKAVKAEAYVSDQDARVLGMRISRLLEARSLVANARERRGIRIDRRTLPRVPFGEREVFVEERRAARVDTAILIVVDRSGSMIGDPREVARSAALRVCLAVEGIVGATVGCVAFPEQLDGRSDQVREILPMGAPVRMYADGFLWLNAPHWASTPMHTALAYARYALSRRKEPRRVCIVLTDGAPDNSALVEPELARLEEATIECVGIGIGTMAVELFPRHEVIQAVSELEGALFRLLQAVLAKAA